MVGHARASGLKKPSLSPEAPLIFLDAWDRFGYDLP
jgi:hypothetical protein